MEGTTPTYTTRPARAARAGVLPRVADTARRALARAAHRVCTQARLWTTTPALTPLDTLALFNGAWPMMMFWGSDEVVLGLDELHRRGAFPRGWRSRVAEAHPGADGAAPASVEVGHEEIVAALRRIARRPRRLRLAPGIVAQAQCLLLARTRDEVNDVLADMEPVGFDAVVQVAVFGDVPFG